MTKNYYLKKTCGIYAITHKETGKQYIGQSIDCFERWKQHQTPKKGSSGIKGAIMKHGVDQFVFEVVEECKKDLLNEREIFYIKERETMAPLGYNLTSGGGQGHEYSTESKKKMSEAGKKRAPPSAETRAKISEAGKNRTMSEEARAKISASHMGMSPSEEARAKISATLTGRKTGSPSDEVKARMSEGKRIGWENKKSQAFSED